MVASYFWMGFGQADLGVDVNIFNYEAERLWYLHSLDLLLLRYSY